MSNQLPGTKSLTMIKEKASVTQITSSVMTKLGVKDISESGRIYLEVFLQEVKFQQHPDGLLYGS